MVAFSGHICPFTDCIINCFRRLKRSNAFRLFHFLMNRIKKNKEILIQLIVFTAMGFLLQKTWMFYIVLFLLLILPFPLLSSTYIKLLNSLLSYLGTGIKTVLFILLFGLVILPVGSLMKLSSKKVKPGYIHREGADYRSTFTKLW
jgi:hypothetical protein